MCMQDTAVLCKWCVFSLRSERTDRFKSERFADDSNLTTSQKRDRGFRNDKIGRTAVVRERRRSSGYRERRFRRDEDDDHETNRVSERLSNPTYVPKGNSYFLVSGDISFVSPYLKNYDSTMIVKCSLFDVVVDSDLAVH